MSEPRTLAGLLRTAAAAFPGQRLRVLDEAGGSDFAALAQALPAGDAACLAGRSVLLVLPSQRQTIAALLALDGLARRIMLWPGGSDRHVNDIAASRLADIVLTQWPPRPDELAQAGAPVPLPAELRPALRDATEWILFTSGTTGRPKPVAHTLGTLARHITPPAAPAETAPVWATFYDIRRYGGLQVLLRAMIGGGSLILSGGGGGETTREFLARCAAACATHVTGTPSHWRRALIAGAPLGFDPGYIRLSGEVADQAVLDRLRAAYPQARIVHAYAATEAGLGFEVTDGRAGFPADLRRGVGGMVEIRVRDSELHLRSPLSALGIRDSETGILTPSADGDAWVHTGDMVEPAGDRLIFAGRRDGEINIGGAKVHPEEVEAVINAHPSVVMSLVTKRRNPVTGWVVAARIVCRDAPAGLTPGKTLGDDIRQFCGARLAAHKVPVSIQLVPAIDVTAGGKMVRQNA